MFRRNEQHLDGAAPASAISGHVDNWEDLAIQYLDGELDPATRTAVDRHLADCPACAARLHVQRSMTSFLQQTPLHDPPAELEDRVLDVLLVSPQAAQPMRRSEGEPPIRSATRRRGFRNWIPATVVAVALLAAVVSYGVLGLGGEFSGEQAATTVAAAASRADETAAFDGEKTGETDVPYLGAGSAETTALEPTQTGASPTTTALGGAAYGPDDTYFYQSEVTQDREKMIAELEAAAAPAYFVFQTAGSTDGTAVPPEQAEAIATQITALTSLTPLNSSLSPGGTLFAAYLSRDEATQLIDLLRSIGEDQQLVVGLDTVPTEEATDFAARLTEEGNALPVLYASQTPRPAADGWIFTTSTLPAGKNPPSTMVLSPASNMAGEHVLVVIYVRR